MPPPSLLDTIADLTRKLTGQVAAKPPSPTSAATPPATPLTTLGPVTHALSPSQERAVEAGKDESIPFLFVTGKAGTGKSTLIREYAKLPKTIIVAPTGIAALNAGGATAHSVFQIPPHFLDPQAPRFARIPILAEVQRVVIDEISMLRADVMDHIDCMLRYNRDDRRPFGGVKMIGVGDCYQLPPVVTEADESAMKLRYVSPWWFDARVMTDVKVVLHELTDVFRQKDEGFVQFLNVARVSQVPQHWLDRFNELCFHKSQRRDDDLVLTSVRLAAEDLNRRRLEALTGPSTIFKAELTGSFLKENERNLPAPVEIELREGARVVVTKNSAGVPNGTLGKVVALKPDRATILADGHKEPIEFMAMEWQKVAYKIGEKRQIELEVTGTLKQMPLLLGWAITIHKAQGMTLPRACIDLGSRTFAPGQAYVALSRVTAMQGLSLRRPLLQNDFFVDPRVTQKLSEMAGHPLMQ